MADLMYAKVERVTRMPGGFEVHAAPEAMAVYLRDWERAHVLLGRRIAELRALHLERLAARDRGEWPPPSPGTATTEGRSADG